MQQLEAQRFHVYSNGKVAPLPTFKGRVHSEETRKLISDALRGQPKPQERIRDQSSVWNIVRPLAERGALVVEIAEIGGLSTSQVRNALYRKRPDSNRQGQIVEEPLEDRRKRAAERFYSPRRKIDRDPLMNDQIKSINFAKRLLDAGFLTENMSHWLELHDIYKKNGREMPHDFSDRLRLEVRLAIEGNKERQQMYLALGKEIDLEWFKRLKGEENFILAQVRSPYVASLYEKHKQFFYTAALWHLSISQNAEDVIQQSIYFLLKTETFPYGLKNEREERNFIFIVVRNAARDFLDAQKAGNRDVRRTEEYGSKQSHFGARYSPSAEDEALKKIELSEAVENAKKNAPMVLYQALGYSREEAAATLHTPMNTLAWQAKVLRSKNRR